MINIPERLSGRKALLQLVDDGSYDWDTLTRLERKLLDIFIQEIKTGNQKTIMNPVAQADSYRYALMELVGHTKVWVTAIVAFPRLSRQAFLNKIANIEVFQNPQSKFFLDLDTVIFKEDVDSFFTNPDTFLKQIVRKKPKFHASTERDIQAVHERLLPNAFRIGDLTQRRKEREQLKIITSQQEKWIFNLDRSASYLLDVAGRAGLSGRFHER